MNEICYYSATALAIAIRTGELSAVEVVEAHLERIAQVNPTLNAVVQLRVEGAREEARRADMALARGEVVGPLHGVPFTVKDSIETAGTITTAGTLGRRGFVPTRDATAVARLRAAGGILLGKTNCTELCAGGETDNAVYGRTNHPLDPMRSPGGSSGGEAAIIAAGGSPLGIGSDFGGSLRGPAHLCGIVALNPTFGRVPRTGHIPPYGGAYDTARIGPLARHVEDLALALSIISGPDGNDPSVVPMPLPNPQIQRPEGIRVAYHTDNGVYPVTPDTAKTVLDAAHALRAAGHQVTEVCPPCIVEVMEIGTKLRDVVAPEDEATIYAEFRQARRLNNEDLWDYSEEWVRRARGIRRGGCMSGAELLAWTRRWDLCKAKLLAFMGDYDAILCPVDPYPALPHGATMQLDFPPEAVNGYTKPWSMVGWPAVVVKGGTSGEGFPIGVQLIATPWNETFVIALANLFPVLFQQPEL